MSNLASTLEQDCRAEPGCEALQMLLHPREQDLGGFSVRRLLPTRARRMIGPWVFFDHMGPAAFKAGEGINVRPHPHIGLATVTYLFEGEILHRDSLGNTQAIRPGDINLMVAGRGIVHSERERPEVTAVDHELHGLQLWLALPEEEEQTEPAFHHYPEADLPQSRVDGVAVRVMMGRAWGLTSPVRTFSETLYAEAHLQPGQTLALPESGELGVYVASGALRIKDTLAEQHTMAVFQKTRGVVLQAEQESRIALIGGAPLGPRRMNWNFVATTRERIDQARNDWRHGRFPDIPDDHDDPIPLPD